MQFRAILTISALSLLLSACASRTAKLPDYGPVANFSMLDSDGRNFDSQSLLGKAWVADFIYTNCPAECPLMSSKMHTLAKQIAGAQDIELLSISVDPARDTPPVLKQFAARYGGATAQWKFLTGTPQTIHQVAYRTFHVGDVINKINHSTKFVLDDKRGHNRGYYSSLGDDDLPRLTKDLLALGGEAS